MNTAQSPGAAGSGNKSDMNKIIFEKRYTRDNGLIIQEVWDEAYMVDYFGRKNPHFPPQVNYIYEGAVEKCQGLIFSEKPGNAL